MKLRIAALLVTTALLVTCAVRLHRDSPRDGRLWTEVRVAPVVPAGPVCNPELWRHIYRPERLRVIHTCLTVTGEIVKKRTEKDGDYHLFLKLDRGYEGLLNTRNISRAKGALVIEVVCARRASVPHAAKACTDFGSNIVIPPVKTRVVVTGTYVEDRDHGWREIHPVTALTPIR